MVTHMHAEAELVGLLALIDQVAANIGSMSAASRVAKRTAAHFPARENSREWGAYDVRKTGATIHYLRALITSAFRSAVTAMRIGDPIRWRKLRVVMSTRSPA